MTVQPSGVVLEVQPGECILDAARRLGLECPQSCRNGNCHICAATLLRGRVRAVTTMSAALWTTPGASAPGAFDDAEDFRAHDVFALRPVLAPVPLLLACGDSDPFVRANHAFVDGFTSPPRSQFSPGGHTDTYWRATAPTLVRFAASALR